MTLIAILTAAIFIAVGLLATVAPAIMGSLVGHDALSRDATNENRAIYGGLNFAVAAALLGTLDNPIAPVVQGVVGLMLLGMFGGRVLSAAIDGMPSARMWGYAALELGFGLPLIWAMLD